MTEISFTYLNGPDIDRLALADKEILDAVESGLLAQGRDETVIEPRVHLEPDPAFRGHFNVLRGYISSLNLAGVKIVGDRFILQSEVLFRSGSADLGLLGRVGLKDDESPVEDAVC